MHKEWIIKNCDTNETSLIKRLLATRGVKNEKDIEDFLNPLQTKLSDPYVFTDMKKCIERLSSAIDNKEKIIIYGDFDADGVTSTSLLYRTLTHLGADVNYFIPDREKQGHGLDTKVLVKIMTTVKPKVLITVDCGISNNEAVNFLNSFKIDVIITDHHEAPEELPNAYAIINPKAPDALDEKLSAKEIESLTSLAGVGVAFKTAQALLAHYEKSDFVFDILPYAAVGTVADVVPLIGEMLDRFISDHLIYVFLRQEGELKLVWPKACKDERIYEALKQLTPETTYVLTNEDKIGAFPLMSEEGEITGCIVARSTLDKLSKRDISYLEQLTRQSAITINRAKVYSKVLQYATLDALTNLNNRRQFEVRLKQEIATTKRQNNPLCAMMIDIDFFKKVNDTYGHASGDAVLRTVALIIKEHLRESDIPSRYGGEEFAVLLPYTHISEAKIVGERLRKAVENTEIPIDKKTINVTISMGLAEFDTKETGEELFERADKALYEAKESGRNRVCISKNA